MGNQRRSSPVPEEEDQAEPTEPRVIRKEFAIEVAPPKPKAETNRLPTEPSLPPGAAPSRDDAAGLGGAWIREGAAPWLPRDRNLKTDPQGG